MKSSAGGQITDWVFFDVTKAMERALWGKEEGRAEHRILRLRSGQAGFRFAQFRTLNFQFIIEDEIATPTFGRFAMTSWSGVWPGAVEQLSR